jgi:hypothetical protein
MTRVLIIISLDWYPAHSCRRGGGSYLNPSVSVAIGRVVLNDIGTSIVSSGKLEAKGLVHIQLQGRGRQRWFCHCWCCAWRNFVWLVAAHWQYLSIFWYQPALTQGDLTSMNSSSCAVTCSLVAVANAQTGRICCRRAPCHLVLRMHVR